MEKIKPESNELNLGDFEDYDFLEDSVIDEQTFLILTDHKIQEMEFYQKRTNDDFRIFKEIYICFISIFGT